MGQLDGRVAIVTGSGRGIGQQIALRLARAAFQALKWSRARHPTVTPSAR